MSDHITVDGKKYFEESYLSIGIETSKRRGKRIAELEAQLAALQAQRDRLVAALKAETKCEWCWTAQQNGWDCQRCAGTKTDCTEATRALLREMEGE